ncbi:MAG: T9SS type A sorting domain-containing protein [Bacteroidales bacterium]
MTRRAGVFFLSFSIQILVFTGLLSDIHAQVPELPEWVRDTIFIDYSESSQGDGSITNPINSFHIDPVFPYPKWDPGQNAVNVDNTAILFKRGVTHDVDPRVQFIGQFIYVGAYGEGEKPLLTLGSRGLRSIGTDHMVVDLIVQGAPQDTTYLTHTWDFLGDYEADNVQTEPRDGFLIVDGLEIIYGYRAIGIQKIGRVDLRNVYLTNIWHDGIFAHAIDSFFIDNLHIENYNREWDWSNYHYTENPADEPGGDGIQITGSVDAGVRYFEMENSIIDGSRYGGKFNFIAAGDTGPVYIRNSMFFMHPYKLAFHAAAPVFHVENCIFVGPGGLGSNWNTRVYNSIFVGTDKDHDNRYLGNYRQGYGFVSGPQEIYNSTFVNYYQVVTGPAYNPNIRNSIFYNITDPFSAGYRFIDGSGNIHWNEDGTEQSGLNKYSDGSDSYFVADPLFVNPFISYTYHDEDSRHYGTDAEFVHHWYEWHDTGDWRLEEESPAIDAADSLVYDREAEFLANVNQDGNAYMRKYTEYFLVTHDIAGTSRPQGNSYDIGAYEWTDGVTVIVPPEGEKDTPPFIIFPNPAKNVVNILIAEPGLEGDITLFIHNSAGQAIYSTSLFARQGETFEIPLPQYRTGVYIIQLVAESGRSYSRAFIIDQQ